MFLMLLYKVIEIVKIGGYDVLKGIVVYCNVYVILCDFIVWEEFL